MTRNRQRVTAEQKAIIKNDYLSGQKPSAIAAKIGLKVATVRQCIWRQGLTEEREQIKDASTRTVGEVIEEARRRHAEKFTGILDKQIEGIEIDTEKLSTGDCGWSHVHSAADISALMRGKTLLQERTLRYFGLDVAREGPTGNIGISFFMGSILPPDRIESTVRPAEHDSCAIKTTVGH